MNTCLNMKSWKAESYVLESGLIVGLSWACLSYLLERSLYAQVAHHLFSTAFDHQNSTDHHHRLHPMIINDWATISRRFSLLFRGLSLRIFEWPSASTSVMSIKIWVIRIYISDEHQNLSDEHNIFSDHHPNGLVDKSNVLCPNNINKTHPQLLCGSNKIYEYDDDDDYYCYLNWVLMFHLDQIIIINVFIVIMKKSERKKITTTKKSKFFF